MTGRRATVSFGSFSVGRLNVTDSVTGSDFMKVVTSLTHVKKVPSNFNSLVSGGRVGVRTNNVTSDVWNNGRRRTVSPSSVRRS